MSGAVLVTFGTRPEAIKMLPVVRELRRRAIPVLVVSTGQHREMLAQVLEAFGEEVDLNLDVMTAGQTLSDLTAALLARFGEVLDTTLPDLVMVHGDTTTAMTAALSSFYRRLPIAHVEAGLRSHDTARPFPEEFNRIAIDAIADLLFAPSEAAAANLRRESPRRRPIAVTGNTGIDALLQMARRVTPATLAGSPAEPREGRRLVLVTGHRRESFGAGLDGICEGLRRIAANDGVEVIYPVHLNPEVHRQVTARLGGLANVRLPPPVSYPEMVALMLRAHLVLTDSGGIQEEAPALGKPVLVTREVTERPEVLGTGVASLVGTDPDRIAGEALTLLNDPAAYAARARPVFPYGDGTAARGIVDAVEAWRAERRHDQGRITVESPVSRSAEPWPGHEHDRAPREKATMPIEEPNQI